MTATLAAHSQPIVLQGISWTTYQSLIQDLESQPGKRLTYNQGILEIMAPLPPHERYKRILGRLVEVATEELGLEIASLGSTTWSRPDLQKGLEADECYYLQHELAIRGKTDIDLTHDPPPDLVIEIDITSSSLNRLSIYAELGVPEIWRYDGTRLTILVLGAGKYQPQDRSLALPLLQTQDLFRFLQVSGARGETSLVREFRQWIRSQTATE